MLDPPAADEKHRPGEGGKEKARPRTQGDERKHGEIEQQKISEQRDLVIDAGGNEQGRAESADDGVEREQFRVLHPGHVSVEGGDGDHGHKRHAGGDEVEIGKRCPQREVEDSAAEGFERVGESGVSAAAKALGPGDEGRAGDKTDEHAAERADPMVVEGELEEPGYSDEHGEDADAVEPLRADAAFERRTVRNAAGGGGLEHWALRRWNERRRGRA